MADSDLKPHIQRALKAHADRARLQRRGHTGIVALLDVIDAAKAAGPEGQDWVDVAYGAGTVRVSVAPATLQMA